MHWRRWALIPIAATLCYAQSGVITGKALDANQNPISGITIHLLDSGGQESAVTKTDADGAYRFSVPRGQYTLRTEGETAVHAVKIAVGAVAHLDLNVKQAEFFDEPQFTVAGVTDNTYRGGHGSDTVLRSAEDLTKATVSLAPKGSAGEDAERAGHPLEAVRELQRAAEADPSEVNLFNWATELLNHRAPSAAMQVYEKGARLFPKSTRMMEGLAASEYQAGNYENAAQWFFKATDLAPENTEPYLFLGRAKAREILASSGFRERMQRFAELKPTNAWANYFYGTALWTNGQAADARRCFEKAVELDSRMDAAYLALGIVLAAQKQSQEAIAAYQKAIDLNPGLEEAHYRLSEEYRKIGNRQRAEQEIAVYQELSKASAAQREQERQEIQQFVIALRQTRQP